MRRAKRNTDDARSVQADDRELVPARASQLFVNLPLRARRLDACSMTGMSSSPPDADGGTVSADWITIETGCHFSFKAPPSYSEKPVQGVDSCVLEFAADDCDYFADYGAFSGSLSSDVPCGRNSVTIDGLEAEVMVCPHPDRPGHFQTGVHFPTTGKSPARLTMVGTCRSRTGAMDSVALFDTIRFRE